MNRVKVALILLTIAIAVGPIAVTAFTYRDNLAALVMPPEIMNLVDGNTSQILTSQITAPTVVGEPQYNPETGVFNYAINFTNPLKTKVSVDQVTGQLKSKTNDELICNISTTQPINIAPGESGVINTSGMVSQETIDRIKGAYQAGTLDLNNLALNNVNVVVSGVTLHYDKLDLDSLQTEVGT